MGRRRRRPQPLSWVRAANARWETWHDNPLRDSHQPLGRTVLGVDVGHLGEDRTVITTRQGDVVMSIESWAKRDTVQVAALCEHRAARYVRPSIVVDGIGIGAGVVDQLRTRGLDVVPFIASQATKRRDSTGTQGFSNLRSAAWWHLRELLDPAMDARLALPPDDDLTADLVTPRFEPVTGGKIKVESKDDIRKRLGRSTDYGDAVVQALWIENYERDRPEPSGPVLRPVAYAGAQCWG